MGIADLTPLLKDRAPNCFVETPAYNLNNRRMAFDGHNWIFTFLGISVKEAISVLKDPMDAIDPDIVFENILRFFLNTNLKLLNYKITPVWIWDSEDYSTPAKTETRTKRREARKKMGDKKNNIEAALKSMSPLERPTELLEEYKKLKSLTFYFPKKYIPDLKALSKKMGLPTITAPGEGEYLAACLAVERIVACVWSGDTDTIALGAPFVTKKFDKRGGELYIQGIFTPAILKAFRFDYTQFRDLCFLLGCDFNDRVPGIGKIRAFDLMVKYRSFDAVVDHLNTLTNKDGTLKYDTSNLNYSVCNELLTPIVSGYADKTDELNVVKKEYDEEFNKYNLRTLIDTILSRIHNLGPAENVPKN